MIVPNIGMIVPDMSKKRAGPDSSPSISLAASLFTGTQQRLIALLFGQPQRSFYATELIALARTGSGAVQRELVRLSSSGLLTAQVIGNQKHYQANPASPIFAELCGIAEKTLALAEPLRVALAPLSKKIRAAFVYGSVAKREDSASSDIDLMLVSDELTYGDLFTALEEVSARLGRVVNPSILTIEEFRKRANGQEAFLVRVLEQSKIWLIGGADDLAV